jgi:DNA polymerase-3 subunit alpha/error-prone DNA polymerase
MALYADSPGTAGVTKACNIPARAGHRVKTAGWLITGKRVRTKKGDPMEFLTFEDETGIVETTFFPEAYDRFAPVIDFGKPYLLWGKVETDWGAATLTVDDVALLPPVSAPAHGGKTRPAPAGSASGKRPVSTGKETGSVYRRFIGFRK